MKRRNLVCLLLVCCLACGMLGATVFAAPASEPDTVMGTTTLYDYERSKTGGSQYLLFGRVNDGYGDHNSWSREEDYRISQGLVAPELTDNGELQLGTVRVKKGKWGYEYVQLSVPNLSTASKGKLFQDGEKVGTYQMPFVFNAGTGRYEYDSKKNNLVANAKTGMLEYTKPNDIGFMPLGTNNYLFGAKTVLPFVYPQGGKVDGKDMVFEFTGDDDVWVFIDGKLALDLGGIHNAVQGKINFRTMQTEIIGKINDGDKNDTVHTEKLDFDTSKKNHEVRIFYLERGEGFSNCKMSFNLVQPTNYTIKYYDGAEYDGKTGDTGLLATVTQTARADGTPLYAGDQVKQSEIKINVNDKTADLIASDLYYGGFVVDENFIKVTDPDRVVTTVTEDDSDTVYVVFLPKPSYTVTYWQSDSEDISDTAAWKQITQKVYNEKEGKQIFTSDIDLSVSFGGETFQNGAIATKDNNGLLGTLTAKEPFNIDVVFLPGGGTQGYYTVTYWQSSSTDITDSYAWTQLTQKEIYEKVGTQIYATDIALSVSHEGKSYENGQIWAKNIDGVLGTVSASFPFNVDVVFLPGTDKPEEPDKPDVPPYKPPYELSNNYAYIFGRTDTLMEPHDVILRGEACAILHRLLKQNNKLGGFWYDAAAVPAFADLGGRWDRSAMEFMVSLGIYNADPSAMIYPANPITRAEAFKLFAVSLGFTSNAQLPIEQYGLILQDAGYIVGYDDGSLGYEKNITRAEMCRIYNGIIGRHLRLTTADGTEVTPATYGFTDIREDWAYDDIMSATSAYDEDGYVDLNARADRKDLDDY